MIYITDNHEFELHEDRTVTIRKVSPGFGADDEVLLNPAELADLYFFLEEYLY